MTNNQQESSQKPKEKPAAPATSQGGPEEEKVGKPLLTWQAPEYSYYEKKTIWFLGFSVILIGLVIFALISRSWIAAVAFILAGFVLLILGRRKPESLEHEISTSGLKVGTKNFPYSKLKSFWIVEAKEGNSLNLEPRRPFHLPLTFQLGSQSPQKVKETLGKYLPEKAKGEDLLDRLIRFLRL